ncbi:MAG: DNA-directed RNA polymerase subunit beta, partial [Candidatus Omnitrophota bacterium]
MINRKNYAKIKECFDIPNLIDIQLDSYAQLLQQDVPKSKRENLGLEELFREMFQIATPNKEYSLEYLHYTIGRPKYSIEECLKAGVSFAGALRVRLRLKTPKDTKEQEVYLCDLPLMTPTGTFIINGDERVVVSQLHRSPGISFEESEHSSGKPIFSARLIPYRGAWVEFEFDQSDVLYVYIDKRRKFVGSIFLRMFGLSKDEDILKAFGGVEKIKITRESQLGEYIDSILAEDIIDDATNSILAKSGERITKNLTKRIWSSRIRNFAILSEELPEVAKTLEKDTTKTREDALLDIYRKVRPGDPPTLDSALTLVDRLFFDPKRYSLGRVGRFMLNRKLSMDADLNRTILDSETLIKAIKKLIKIKNDGGPVDDIDHLGNRRVRSVGELLLNQLRIGMVRLERSVRERMNIYDLDSAMPHNLINAKLISSVVKDFFGRSQLSQFMDQTNPLAELTHKRRLSALGPGGLNRERAGFEVRDVHYSHYGRMCPIETPEGPNIGLITSLSTYARVNEFGFLETPYRKVENGKATNKIEYLSADIEDEYIIAQANERVDKRGFFINDKVFCRYKHDFVSTEKKDVQYMDVSPCQLVSVAASLIPFLEHDDANRALMGSNMQRQSVPLLDTEAPLIGTGMEHKVAKDSGTVIVAESGGKVTSVDGDEIVVSGKKYKLR